MKIIAALLLLACGVSTAAAETLQFRGYAYDLKTNRYLYTEVHEQVYEGDVWKSGRIRFFDAAGKPIGQKTLDFSSAASIPVYRFELPAEHYVEAITAVSKTEVKLLKTADGKTSEKTLKRTPTTAADSGFHTYLVSHFDELMAGKTVAFNFVVAGNLDAYSFRAKRIADTQFEGKPAVRFRVEPDSLLRYLVSPLELSYDEKQRKLLEYKGISNVHDPKTGKAYNARIIFPDQPPTDAPKSLPPLS